VDVEHNEELFYSFKFDWSNSLKFINSENAKEINRISVDYVNFPLQLDSNAFFSHHYPFLYFVELANAISVSDCIYSQHLFTRFNPFILPFF
jgi:hypothetical protein